MSAPHRPEHETLTDAAAEIEAHVALAGWDQRPTLFALVRAGQFALDDPAAARQFGLDSAPPDALTPVEQEPLPDQAVSALDDVLGEIAWPDEVSGCAVSHEILILPPEAEAAVSAAGGDMAAAAAAVPERREARLVVAVLRDGTSAAVLRLRDRPDEVLTGPDLAPNLSAALLATLR